MDKKLENMKKEYLNVPVPEELDYVVKKALRENGVNSMNRKSNTNGNTNGKTNGNTNGKTNGNTNGKTNGKTKNNTMRNTKRNTKPIRLAAASIAAAFVVLILGVNTSQALAATLSKVPVVGSIVKVLTFREYTVNEDTYNANIKVPAIQNLEDETLKNSLNEKYIEEGKKLYEQFNADMEELKKNGGGYLGVDSGYEVKTDNDRILSIGRYTVNTVASSSTTIKYDTIDKKNAVLITLPSLFKDDNYVDIISENIKKQMIEQNKADSYKFYWVEGIEQEGTIELFEKITKDQSFYINPEGKLVISFDKYEVAPGYMGVVEFVIPTDILSDILVSNEYIN